MNSTFTAMGLERSWSLLNKLGEGDAGEVYLVESILDHRYAILKRPRKSAFTSDLLRQASQIENEGKILQALNGLRILLHRKNELPPIDIRVPLLLDKGPESTEFSERFFIVVEKASGYSLSEMARIARFGRSNEDGHEMESPFLNSIAVTSRIPQLILLRMLAGLLQMFQAIHNHSQAGPSTDHSGIIWNDVKPDHLFWDPQTASITVIDWGNAQFLQSDGFTKDRRGSKNDDYAQLLQTFRTFLTEVNPELLSEINWPENSSPVLSSADQLQPVLKKLNELIKQSLKELSETRQAESDLLNSTDPDIAQLQNLLNNQKNILNFGELPDFLNTERFCTQIAIRLAQEGRLSEFAELSSITCHIHAANPLKWQTLSEIVQIAAQQDEALKPIFLRAIASGVVDDWASTIWNLLMTTASQAEPAWWDDTCNKIRQMGLSVSADAPFPLVILRRNLLMMQSKVKKLRDQLSSEPDNSTINEKQIQSYESLIKTLREEVAIKWEEIEPGPPDSGLLYSDIDRLIDDIGDFLPEARQNLDFTLEQPRNQVDLILRAWNSMDFDSARYGLRKLLLWDPDRRRVLMADQAIAKTPKFLEKIKKGPQESQVMLEFITEVEFNLRELRNQVGPAEWLDSTLELTIQLRKGRKSIEIIAERPEITALLPWLDSREAYHYVPIQPARRIPIDRQVLSQVPEPTIQGIQESILGQGQDLLLADPLDTWAPEARGSSARTFVGFLRNPNGQLKQAAIKIMRGDRIDYGLPLFREEIQILQLMRDVQGVVPMLECGFIQLETGLQLPPDNRPLGGRGLTGRVNRLHPNQSANFLTALESRANQGWLPYLALPKLDNQENLMWICDAGYTRGRFLPVEESIRLALQICDILNFAHQRNIVYRDHKLLHYYWSEIYNGVFMIDWNVARFHPEGLSQEDIQFDLVQLGARALHHIITGRVAPGALADGPNRVEEIEAASNSYRPQWTYDDQRLPPTLKEILEKVLAAGYNRVTELRQDLHQVYLELIDESEVLEKESE